MSDRNASPAGAPADGVGTLPLISVVMTTYNRAGLLGDAVRSILAQEGAPPYEFIVVDNNSTDDTRELVAGLAREDARLRYVFEGRQGVSHGRNAGIRAAHAPIVAFTDDDVRARPDWTHVIVRAFAEFPDVDFVGGRVLPRWPAPPPPWLTRDHWSPLALLDLGDQPVRIDPANPRTLVMCNAAFRRAALERVGGFDPCYQHALGAVAACEDHELELRVLRTGGGGLYLPDMVVEADVQVKRLTRAYHRRWHRDHGRALVSLLAAGETFDSHMQPIAIAPGKPTLFGAAPWAYRVALTSAVRAAGARLLGRGNEAFRYVCDFHDAIGHIAGCVRRKTRPAVVGGQGPSPT